MVASFAMSVLGWSGSIRFFCQDESRFGLKTLTGRCITARGVKPKRKVRWTFQATYLYGVIEYQGSRIATAVDGVSVAEGGHLPWHEQMAKKQVPLEEKKLKQS